MPELLMPCPECRKVHRTIKSSEVCVLSCLKRYLLLETLYLTGKQAAAAHIKYVDMLAYYKALLLRDNHPKSDQEVTVLVDQPDAQGEIYGKSLLEKSYSAIIELRHRK